MFILSRTTQATHSHGATINTYMHRMASPIDNIDMNTVCNANMYNGDNTTTTPIDNARATTTADALMLLHVIHMRVRKSYARHSVQLEVLPSIRDGLRLL